MYRFFAIVHARPDQVGTSSELTIGERSLTALDVPPAVLAASAFECSFEMAYDRLEALERMFIEPDGSFVWTSSAGEARWQVDGHLYDRAGQLTHVELKGTCPAAQFDRLLGTLDWPRLAVVFQLAREAVVVEEAEFRRLAEQR